MILYAFLQLRRPLYSLLRYGEADNTFTLNRVRLTGYSSLNHSFVRDGRILYLYSAYPMPGYFGLFIGSAQQPEIAIFVPYGVVTGIVHSRKFRPVGLLVSFRVSIDSHKHTRPCC